VLSGNCLLVALALAAAPSAPMGDGGATAAAAEPTVTVVAVGHIVMGTSYPPDKKALAADGGKRLFDDTKPIIQAADIAFGNLAAPLSDRGATHKHVDGVTCFAFRTPPSFGKWLKDAGFDVVNAANNHIYDFGPDAYEDTLKNLDALGIGHTGRKDEAWLTEVNGIKVAVVGFTQPYHHFFESHHDIPAAAEVVKRAKEKADVVIVGFHGGTEGANSLHTPRTVEFLDDENRGEVVKLSRALIDAGADLVVGFGPHLPRAMEIYKGKTIDYALGNFLTYGPFNLRGASGLSLILETKFNKKGDVLQTKIYPVVVNKPGIPRLDPTKATLKHLRELSRQDFPESYPDIDDDGLVRARPAATSK
jgi:poly-gamma-glutamate capsule biosynthesis protein CapA/YwtB (metallophosphatase superfamily)